MLRILLFLLASLAAPLHAQSYGPLQTALQAEPELVERASRRNVAQALSRLADFDGITIFDRFHEKNKDVTTAAASASSLVETRLAVHQVADLGLDALSLASICFLAAVGLAVTFGVIGVINMAHGEFIMIGAYTSYLVPTIIPDYTLSLIVALPLAFLVAGLAGVTLERLVIRHLMHRPLETLLPLSEFRLPCNRWPRISLAPRPAR